VFRVCARAYVSMFVDDSEYMCESRSGFVSASLYVYVHGCLSEYVSMPLYASVSMCV
jgi:hypothetical protein